MRPWGRVAHWAVAAVIGVGLAAAIGGPTVGWLVAAAVAALTPRVPGPLRAAVLVGLLAAAAAAHERAGQARPLPDGVDDRAADTVEGWIAGPLTALPGATGMVVESAVGPIWVVVDGAPAAWPGDRVRISGRLMTPRGFRNPGSPDRQVIARNRGAHLELRATGLRVLAAGDRVSAWRWPAQAARGLSARIAARGGDPVGNALVRALVVGDRSGLDDATDEAWRAAGVYHALSVSGLHLAVVALLAFAALTRAFAYLPAVAGRIAPRRAAAVACAPLAIAYVLVTGGQVAAVRALIVVGVALAAAFTERAVRTADALGLAALLAIATRPSVVLDPSFQLSFVAAATLIVAAHGRRRDPSAPRWRRMIAAVVASIRLSWIVTLTTAPITAWHFGQVALGGVIGNLIVGPALELCALPLGVVGALVPGLGGPLLDVAIAIAGLTARVVAAVAAVTPTLEVRDPTAVELAAAVAVGLAWGAWRVTGRRAAGAVAAVAAMVLIGAWWRHDAAPDDALTITFLDVGQGDAAVIEWPDGAVWLVDAGGAPGAGSSAGELAPGRAVAGFLRARGIARIEVAIISHPHPDHYLGLLAVAARVPIAELWEVAEAPADGAAAATAPILGRRSYQAVAAALAVAGTRRRHPALGHTRRGDVTVEILAPRHGDHAAATADPLRSVNDNSLVLRLTRAGISVALLGDVEAEGEAALVAAGLGPTTVVKAAHHGSPTSSSPALVAATRPRWVVLSLGRANRFGFPAPAVVERWRDGGATALRTDQVGAITVRITAAGGVAVTTYDRPPRETPVGPRVIMPR